MPPMSSADRAVTALALARSTGLSCALVGPTGSGKTTLVRAVAKEVTHYTLWAPSVEPLANRDFAIHNMQFLRWAPERPYLFYGTGTYIPPVPEVWDRFILRAPTVNIVEPVSVEEIDTPEFGGWERVRLRESMIESLLYTHPDTSTRRWHGLRIVARALAHLRGQKTVTEFILKEAVSYVLWEPDPPFHLIDTPY